jgi:Xaa-Pro aminopeptidase
MTAASERAGRLHAPLDERSLDFLLVTNLVNVRYLTGFGGSNGVCLIGRDERIFLTDFRYADRAKEEVPDYERVQGRRDLLGDVAELVSGRREANGAAARLGFDDENLTVSQHTRLREALPHEVELVPAGGLVEGLRAVKDEDELEAMRAAAEIADSLYRWLIEKHGLAGRTELAVARALERRAQDSGAEAVAFGPIVAAAENGARPHASPRDVEIPKGSLVVVDLGCRVNGYCSDCTRTFATGDLDGEAAEVYELVRSAQAAAAAEVRPGAGLEMVDAVAREPIIKAGRGEQFGHGLGHGVGLEVHERPRLAPQQEGALETGNAVTVEPGVYVPGRFGVRIEDLVVVRPGGPETLTSTPRDLITV